MATYDLTVSAPSKIVVGDIINIPYSGEKKTLTLPSGEYKLEVWGAQGGNSTGTSGNFVSGSGLGGYSCGVINISSTTSIYIYVGGQGGMMPDVESTVTVPGGFNGGGYGIQEGTGEPGNGGGGATDIRINKDSLYSRVIVAGGGGGSGEDNESGGYGGGTTGGAGSGNTSLTQASQTTAGQYASFGQGGNTGNGGGGGGGWYGGASRNNGSGGDSEGGGGGSGWVYTLDSFSVWQSGNSSDASKYELTSEHYLSKTSLMAGNESFTSPEGSTETGHAGNGYARITMTGKPFRFRKTYDLTKTDVNILYTGDIVNVPFSGSAKSLTLTPGTYKFEVWGAQGGYRSNNASGKGGYSVGTIKIKKRTKCFIYVGGFGTTSSDAVSGVYPGGFNGGGYRYGYKNAGGGATDIRINTDSLFARIIVAGGGGSDGSTSNIGGYAGGTEGARGNFGYGSYGYGGNQIGTYTSGNLIETQGTTNSSSNCYAGFGFGGLGYYTSSGYGGAGGGGWYGGQGTCPDGSGDDDGGGGGGSGWVYTPESFSTWQSGNATHAAQWLLNSDYYLIDATTTGGDKQFDSPYGSTETGHTGDGYARITAIDVCPVTYVNIDGAWKDIIGLYSNINGKWKSVNYIRSNLNNTWKE